jgi:hypothetical protein
MGHLWLGMQDSNLRMTESKSVALPTWLIPNKYMGRLMGLEPTHAGATILCLNHLTTTAIYGVPTGIRTPDLRLRRPLLYPAELLAQILERVKGIEPSQPAWKAGALPLSYTRKMVGVAGFEPATLWSQTRCATKLRYTPFC